MKESNQPVWAASPVALIALTDAGELALASSILSDAGYRLLLARTCREALRQLSSGQPRIVLCDRNLRDGDWKDLISWFAESLEPPRVVVLAGDDANLRSEASNLGAYGVVARPIDTTELRCIALRACGVELPVAGPPRIAPGTDFGAASRAARAGRS